MPDRTPLRLMAEGESDRDPGMYTNVRYQLVYKGNYLWCIDSGYRVMRTRDILWIAKWDAEL